ncbi:MAG: tRNA (N6-isopentenyl adenosine(37)-C2)-methylthiotransferase MiaB [Deltaproteobacteria bacterium]|nr:tRNA (N6-isopentenyl adenosine(37)-C2)-methylthiotransferase MiaB [Deltaproteobacteria bacterium]MCB9786061.1 tRNA (N6-isopentenyl adenosine(37)-C2)-methylthiotransferase MiaB [Deltaproteobacteria bacterium]
MSAVVEEPENAPVGGGPDRFVYVQTFGCQMNVVDTDRIFQVLAPLRYQPTDDPSRADLILLNTCSVREKAEQKMLSELGRLAPLKDFNDDLVLGVAGCVAQQEGARLLDKVPYLDLVMGPDNIAQLPGILERVRAGGGRVAETTFAGRKDYEFIEAVPQSPGKVSEFVTIMKGCDKVCTFCIVPFTRGREVSKPAELVVREVETLVASGVREVTLLGQNVNSYGKDRERQPHFAELLRAVDAVPGLERLRFTTSHPTDCTDELIDCFGELRTLCEAFHLPVQCGSDRVLQAMRRPYTVEHYLGRVARLRSRVPDMALTTDIMVGFPGETEAEFEATLALLAEVRYSSIFAFKYSARPGTRAASMPDDVPEAEKQRRLREVQRLQDGIYDAMLADHHDKTFEVLVEGPSRNAARGGPDALQLMGRTRQNIVVNFPVPVGDLWSRRWIGKLAPVRVDRVHSHSLHGQLA